MIGENIMATNFPKGIDNFINPTTGSYLNGPGVKHSEQHTNLNDAVRKIQERIGITGSLDSTSLEYEIHNVSHGHDHDGISSRPVKLGVSGSDYCSFDDGLYTTWSSSTIAGEAICEINKILKGLVPSPAPVLTTISSSNVGVSGKLSFGTSQSIVNYTNVLSTSSLPLVDINETYEYKFHSDDISLGIFNGDTNITGYLNPGVMSQLPNYPESSFYDSRGQIILELNSLPFLSANLSSTNGFINSYSENGSYLIVSASSPARFENGTEVLEILQHRRGHYNINHLDQRNGWNVLKFIYLEREGDYNSVISETNTISWVVDDDKTPLTAPYGSLHSPNMSGLRHLTGIKYFTNGTVVYETAISSAYKNTYKQGNAITFNTTNISMSPQELTGILTGSENENKIENISKTGTITANKLLPGSLTASINCSHPLGQNLTNGGLSYLEGIMLYNKTQNSTPLRDRFQDENYRLLPSSGSNDYDLQADIFISGWDNTKNWTNSLESLPLIVYNDNLVALAKLPNSGNGKGDFSNFELGPVNNVDYSNFSGSLYYYRKFKNETGSSRFNFSIYLTGSANIVTSSLDLGLNDNFLLEFKIPEQTGWNVFSPFGLAGNPQIPDDGAGILDGEFDNTLNSKLNGTFGVNFVSDKEHVVMRITADSQWTGYISDIKLEWV